MSVPFQAISTSTRRRENNLETATVRACARNKSLHRRPWPRQQVIYALSPAASGLAYLFAASGRGRISGKEFDPIELPARAIVAVPASSPDFVVEDVGGLDLIRITPNGLGHVL